jgi:hypothetical protein
MTLEDLKSDPLFRALTDKQQQFVLAYAVEGKDHITAALGIYDCKDRNSARAVAGAVLRNTYVQSVIARYHGATVVTREEYEAVMWNTIQAMKALRDKKEMLVLFGKMKGYLTPTAQAGADQTADFLAEFKEG